MSQPDWSNAPEGATHYFCMIDAHEALKQSKHHQPFYASRADIRTNEAVGIKCDGKEFHVCLSYWACISRPQWKEGELPPVGTVCEVFQDNSKPGGRFERCTIIGHDKPGEEPFAVFRIDGGIYGASPWDMFRPIKSERDRQIEAMLKLDPDNGRFTSRTDFCGLLYDAGCRLPKEKI
jgi:hypothetical protein